MTVRNGEGGSESWESPWSVCRSGGRLSRRYAGGVLAAALVLGMFAGTRPAGAETLQQPLFVPDGLPNEVAQQLRTWERRLRRQLNGMLEDGRRFDTVCHRVPKGSPADRRCGEDRDRIRGEVLQYNPDVAAERNAVWRAVTACQEATARYEEAYWQAAEGVARFANNPDGIRIAERERQAAEDLLAQLKTPVEDENLDRLLPPKVSCLEPRLLRTRPGRSPILRNYVPEHPAGLILRVRGPVYLLYHDHWVRVGPKTLIGVTDRLLTGRKGFVRIVRGDGMGLIDLGADTSYQGKEPPVRLKSVRSWPTLKTYLRKGSAHLRECLQPDANCYPDTFETDFVGGAPRGTEYVLEVRPDGTTTVTVLSGMVAVTGRKDGRKVLVHRGERVTVTSRGIWRGPVSIDLSRVPKWWRRSR